MRRRICQRATHTVGSTLELPIKLISDDLSTKQVHVNRLSRECQCVCVCVSAQSVSLHQVCVHARAHARTHADVCVCLLWVCVFIGCVRGENFAAI